MVWAMLGCEHSEKGGKAKRRSDLGLLRKNCFLREIEISFLSK